VAKLQRVVGGLVRGAYIAFANGDPTVGHVIVGQVVEVGVGVAVDVGRRDQRGELVLDLVGDGGAEQQQVRPYTDVCMM
jgi:TPP-dependent pyruvate/acetoin dehydrogenase alpha subunit